MKLEFPGLKNLFEKKLVFDTFMRIYITFENSVHSFFSKLIFVL
jgi:hypothetical protein